MKSIKKNYKEAPITIHELNTDNEIKIINSYKKNEFVISKKIYYGPQILFPRKIIKWCDNSIEKIDTKKLISLFNNNLPQVLIIGSGKNSNFNFTKIRKEFVEKSINIEIMSTPAACRTWNVLVSEGRNVAALLFHI